MMGLEPMTSPLPRECSTTELHQPLHVQPIAIAVRPFVTHLTRAQPTDQHACCKKPEQQPCQLLHLAGVDRAPQHQRDDHTTRAGYRHRRTLVHLVLRSNKTGAQGRIRTSVARCAADLQSAAINHSATCALRLPGFPWRIPFARVPSARQRFWRLERRLWAGGHSRGRNPDKQYNQTLLWTASRTESLRRYWSWRRDSNPRPPDYKSGALPAELRQPDSGPSQRNR